MVLNGAIVGFGNVARHGHWPAYQQSRSLRIVALVDPHLSREAANHDLPVYPSITLAASDHRLDFVDICAPPASHAPLVLEALNLNLHAIVEKPLVLTTDDFDVVARIALARSRIVLPVHNWRYAPALQQASATLHRGEIGALRSAEIDVWRPAACGSADSPAWRQNRAVAGGGIVLDHGWHAFYLMMEWFGGRPDTVDGWCHAEPPQDVETDAGHHAGLRRAYRRSFPAHRAVDGRRGRAAPGDGAPEFPSWPPSRSRRLGCRARGRPDRETRTPPVATAPIASSSWPGMPSFRTTKTSRGACSARATSYATGTPPRGSASTRTSGLPAYCSSFSAASRRPASVRSRNNRG